MKNESEPEPSQFHAVINQHGQYSIWPAARAIPHGWRAVMAAGTREQCLEHIEAHWTDIRPKQGEEAMWPRPDER